IRLRINEPDRPRPYRSPFGVVGAVVCLVLCVAGMVSIIYSGVSSYEFLASIIVAILYFGIGAVYFVVHVQSRFEVAPNTKTVRENLLSSASSKV
ncbi:hypothetical protein JM18_009080, partial [Phytophthora kernoviae]